MGVGNSKDRKIDECTSNSSLSNLRYVITEKPKWKVFKKKEIRQLPTKGCPCGNNGPCKQIVTPNGVTIHYPKKKKKFSASFAARKSVPKPQKGYFSSISKRLASIKKRRIMAAKRFSECMFMPMFFSQVEAAIGKRRVGRSPAMWDHDLRKAAGGCWMRQAEDRALSSKVAQKVKIVHPRKFPTLKLTAFRSPI